MNKNHRSTFAGCASVAELLNRILLLPVLLTAVGSVLLECAVFWLGCHMTYRNDDSILPAFELLVSACWIPIFAGVGFILLSLFVASLGGINTGYTLRRLSVTDKTVTILHSGYNALCYFLYWMAQLTAVWLMYRIYILSYGADAVTSQSFALGFWRSTYLHGLLPLSEPLSMALNFCIVVVLGFTTAAHAFFERHGRKHLSRAWLMVFWTGFYFTRRPGLDFRPITLSVFLTVCFLLNLYQVWAAENDEEVAAS